MEQIYNKKMNELGYGQFVCDIFLNWEDVKDEILLPDRKQGSGNGTVHIFLGAADECLKKEFPGYYKAVTDGEDPSVGAIKITHYFVKSNVLSMLGYVCEYYKKKDVYFLDTVINILTDIDNAKQEDGLLSTSSLLKLSIGSNKLRPYFKQFDSKGIFHQVIRQLLLPNSAYKIALYKNANDEYAAFWLIGFGDLDDFMADVNKDKIEKPLNELKKCEKSLQQIFYGAPGTGKSFKIKRDTKNQSKIRTTFHPDSDYSTFVGCYKPTMNEDVKYDKEGNEKSCTKQIEYAFVAQAFLKAYVKAWKFYCSAEDGTAKAQYLIIEEINRGNCAQIFGDLFQLLDRNEDGYSTYPIVADTDIQRYLSKEFEKVNIPDSLNAIYDDYDGNIVEDIKNGIVLALPNNLYIWATMNTSDQSLFPIDSAFKRRWDWKYMPIDTKKENWNIEVDGKKYSWSDFLEAVNEQIFEVTKSEDKKLGFYFCRANNHVVDAEKFVSKVIFYLYNDVFKDYGYDRKMFQGEDGKTIQFHEYFQSNGDINEQKAALFLNNLEIKPIGENNVE
jgi:conserved domain protein